MGMILVALALATGTPALADGVTAGLCRTTAKFEEKYGDLSKLEPWPIEGKLHHWERRYVIHAPIERVFEAYMTEHPADVWPKEFVDFQFAYPPGSDRKIHASDPWPRVEQGTRIFVDLKLQPGKFCKMMVSVLVSRVEAPRLIRYDYLEGSINRGVNQFELEPGVDGEGRPVTYIHHVTDWSDPSLVLKLILPFVYERHHGGVINGIHNGIKAVVEGTLRPEKP